MESLIQLREKVKQILQSQIGEYHTGDVKDTLIENSDSNRFLVICTGWFKEENFYGVIQDVAVSNDGIVTIYVDNTEEYLAEELIEAGVPAEKVVKAYERSQLKQTNQQMKPETEYRQAA